MTESGAYEQWLDEVASGGGVDVGRFAKSAIGDLPRPTTPIRYPTNKSAWPADVWAEMEAIRKGERDGDCSPLIRAELAQHLSQGSPVSAEKAAGTDQ